MSSAHRILGGGVPHDTVIRLFSHVQPGICMANTWKPLSMFSSSLPTYLMCFFSKNLEASPVWAWAIQSLRT